jgi:hypothetical protein
LRRRGPGVHGGVVAGVDRRGAGRTEAGGEDRGAERVHLGADCGLARGAGEAAHGVSGGGDLADLDARVVGAGQGVAGVLAGHRKGDDPALARLAPVYRRGHGDRLTRGAAIDGGRHGDRLGAGVASEDEVGEEAEAGVARALRVAVDLDLRDQAGLVAPHFKVGAGVEDRVSRLLDAAAGEQLARSERVGGEEGAEERSEGEGAARPGDPGP